MNVAAYALFSSSKYLIDLICCLSKQSKIDFIWHFSDLYVRFIETLLVLKEAIYSKLLNFMQSHFFIIHLVGMIGNCWVLMRARQNYKRPDIR